MTALPAESYTLRRLEHATPEHLHLTTRRTFIGPIPKGWLDNHRKQWYRTYVSGTSGRAPTFTAAHPIASSSRNNTRLEQPSNSELLRVPEEETPRPSSQTADTRTTSDPAGPATSTTSLLHHQRREVNGSDGDVGTRDLDNGHTSTVQTAATDAGDADGSQTRPRMADAVSQILPPKVRFSEATRLQLRERAERIRAKGSLRSTKIKPGELMKMEKMLVRIDITQQSIKEGFDERISQGVETKTLDKWREFMVVCRKHPSGALLQLYQTRVIATTTDKTKKRPKYEIILSQIAGNANMYSSLDKTLCVWNVQRDKTYIYYLRAQSGAASVEWLTFLRGVLGHGRADTLQVNVPGLSVSLRLEDPFDTLESSTNMEKAASGDDSALARAVSDEEGAAAAIVTRCIEMLKQSEEWSEVLTAWLKDDRMGLAWKRYDRLEWIHGAAEQRMYGTMAMQRSHDLELRPKDHYPCRAKTKKEKILEEPRAVEGFLIRLTSQRGHERSYGRMMYKRLYFTTHNQYLLFTRPARAVPPPPPKTSAKGYGSIPSTQEFLQEAPLTYDIDPYPLVDGQIAWLDTEGVQSRSEQQAHDRDAFEEADRNIRMLLACDGFINICDIKRVRKFHKGATALDEHLDDGSDVDFHDISPERRGEDGRTKELDEDRTFELVMKNGLVIRLQAYSEEAKKHWIKALRPLVKYWKLRSNEDMDLFKSVREQNLETLQIDERAEAQVGSFAYKWEVSQSYASPILYNLCGISSCRTIHMSGELFRKPRKHSTFTRCQVILSAGHLLIFQDTLRKHTGKKLIHSHLERLASVDLQGCYLYSGLLTENELLYQNQTFDSNTPGNNALPRIFLEDQWTSTDEDAMTTFVIWHAKSKSWFRSSQSIDDVRLAERQNSINSRGEVDDGRRGRTKTKLTRVSQLGVTGRSVVFKARSRAERDHWVLAIQVEIERLAAQDEEVRIIDGDGQ